MQKYLDDLRYIRLEGNLRGNRTGIPTLSVFGMQTRYNLQEGFPAMTTKKLAWKAVVSELLWFIEGSGDERRLAEILHGTRDPSKHTIWTANANADYWKPKALFEGDLGRVYGTQWRDWGPRIGEKVDQLTNLIEGIKKDPEGRRHIITAWNPGELDQMALPPCHLLSQFNVVNGQLDCLMYQRSNDFFLGCPFNIASYSLLTHMIAQVCGLGVRHFIHVNGDAHIYTNHLDQVAEQLAREPYPLPQLWLNPEIKDITKFTMDDIKLLNYKHHGPIKAEMAV
jgi:thymidylate synthase